MTDTNTTAAIKLLSSVLGCPPESISPEDDISTLGKWDSLNHMRLILLLEEKLGHQVDTDDAATLFSVAGIADYLDRHQR